MHDPAVEKDDGVSVERHVMPKTPKEKRKDRSGDGNGEREETSDEGWKSETKDHLRLQQIEGRARSKKRQIKRTGTRMQQMKSPRINNINSINSINQIKIRATRRLP